MARVCPWHQYSLLDWLLIRAAMFSVIRTIFISFFYRSLHFLLISFYLTHSIVYVIHLYFMITKFIHKFIIFIIPYLLLFIFMISDASIIFHFSMRFQQCMIKCVASNAPFIPYIYVICLCYAACAITVFWHCLASLCW